MPYKKTIQKGGGTVLTRIPEAPVAKPKAAPKKKKAAPKTDTK